MSAVILDLDGTLVDSVPLHVVAWHQAFADADHVVPTTAIHAAIGLGSTRLIRHLLGWVPSSELEQRLRDGHRERFLDGAGSLQPTPGASALLRDLADRQVPFVVATSAGSAEREALLAVLGDPDLAVTDADGAGESKPDPDPLRAALDDLGTDAGPAVQMVGDAPWDGWAAAAAGVGFVAVRSGGFSDAVLRSAGARRIADHAAGLIGTL